MPQGDSRGFFICYLMALQNTVSSPQEKQEEILWLESIQPDPEYILKPWNADIAPYQDYLYFAKVNQVFISRHGKNK